MIRGTTPTLEFVLPFSTDTIAEVFVTLAQSGNVIITRKNDSCSLDGEKLSVRLTQEETLKLKGDSTTEIQLRIRTINGDALASEIIKEPTHRILQDGEI